MSGREWRVGSREWGVGRRVGLSALHSPLSTPHSPLFWLLLSCMALVSTGCNKSGDSPFGPGKESKEMALSSDPDKRVAAINSWSAHDWGLRGDYLKFYASAVRHDDAAVVRSAALRALGKARDAATVETIAYAMRDPATAVRLDAAWALDQVLGEAAIEQLRAAALADPSNDVRIAAIKAIRHYRMERVVTALVSCLDDKNFGIRLEAHSSLVYIYGRDLGNESENWQPIVGRLLEPRPQAKPWWDPFGLTVKPQPAAPNPGK